MRHRPSLPLLAGAFLLASPILRANDVEIGTWTFNTAKQFSIGVVKSERGASEKELENEGILRVDVNGDYFILMDEGRIENGKGSGLGRKPKTSVSVPGGTALKLKAIFKDGAMDLDQVLRIQVGTYSPFKVWIHRKGSGDPIRLELGDGMTSGPAIAKVKIQDGDLTYTD